MENIKQRVIFSETDDSNLSDIIKKNDCITGTIEVDVGRRKAVFVPDEKSSDVCPNVIIDGCGSIEVNSDYGADLYNGYGRWLFEAAEEDTQFLNE